MNWDYIAGFFDGEGCIWIKHNKKGHPAPYVSISQKEEAVLQEIASFLQQQGINARVYTTKKEVRLQIGGRQSVRLFLLKLRKKVIVKKEKLIEVLPLTYNTKVTFLSVSEIKTIIRLHKKGTPVKEIAKKCNRHHSTVYRLINNKEGCQTAAVS